MPLPAKPLHEHILIVHDDAGRREILLTEPVYTIGRSRSADIRVRSQFVSRIHAFLKQVSSSSDVNSFTYQICDGDDQGNPSVNGLLINQIKRSEHLLQPGDEVILGHQASLIYQYRRRDQFATLPNDQFDITLIDPSMLNDDDDDNVSTNLNIPNEDCP